ncbi:LPXTG cell wall anchor domain-containing protein [Corynebacterium canis]
MARTGASVLGVVALAGLAVAAGVFLVRRGRNNS